MFDKRSTRFDQIKWRLDIIESNQIISFYSNYLTLRTLNTRTLAITRFQSYASQTPHFQAMWSPCKITIYICVYKIRIVQDKRRGYSAQQCIGVAGSDPDWVINLWYSVLNVITMYSTSRTLYSTSRAQCPETTCNCTRRTTTGNGYRLIEGWMADGLMGVGGSLGGWMNG